MSNAQRNTRKSWDKLFAFMRKRWGTLNLRRVNLQYADLRNMDLHKANLRHADLRGANLWQVNLQDAILYKADLRGADIRNANLKGAVLDNADLESADLRGANLTGALMIQTHLYNASLYAVGISKAVLNTPLLNNLPKMVVGENSWRIGEAHGTAKDVIEEIESANFSLTLVYLCYMLALSVLHAPKETTRFIVEKVIDYAQAWLTANK